MITDQLTHEVHTNKNINRNTKFKKINKIIIIIMQLLNNLQYNTIIFSFDLTSQLFIPSQEMWCSSKVECIHRPDALFVNVSKH